MSITKPLPLSDSKNVEAELETFVAAAPGASASAEAPATRRYLRAGRPRQPKNEYDPNEIVQVAFNVSRADLEKIDAKAFEVRMTRAGYVRSAIFGYIASNSKSSSVAPLGMKNRVKILRTLEIPSDVNLLAKFS